MSPDDSLPQSHADLILDNVSLIFLLMYRLSNEELVLYVYEVLGLLNELDISFINWMLWLEET